MNGKKAFTLVELLVVVAIIGLLVAILMPELAAVKELGRMTVCQTHLKQMFDGFNHGEAGSGMLKSKPFPGPDGWPATPMNVLPNPEIYLCPSDGDDSDDVPMEAYSIHYGADCGDLAGFSLLIAPESDGYGHGGSPICRVEDMGDWTLYIFDDGLHRDLDDWAFRVTKDYPRVATRILNPYNPGSSPSGERTCSIWANGQPLAGWEDMRDRSLVGQSFIMSGEGVLDYGFNALVDGVHVAPDTLVTMDYPRRLAHSGEDMTVELAKAARHRGKLNVLRADGSVKTARPSELDPAIGNNAQKWTP